jgi:MFS family permease
MNNVDMLSTVDSQPPNRWLNRTVLGAGVTSALGAIEGVADVVSRFTKLGAGYIADRLGHRKSLVAFGYALTAIGQAFIAVATDWRTGCRNRSQSDAR